MNTILLTVIIAVIAVAFLMFSMMITYFRKGHHIQSEIGDNPHMKKRGINCTSRTIMEEERAIFGDKIDFSTTCAGSCYACDDECSTKESDK